MIIITIGDSHGNAWYLRNCFDYAKTLRDKVGSDVILISLGDFGFWPSGHGFIKSVKRMIEETGVPLWVIDGNHDYPGFGSKTDAGYLGYSESNPIVGKTTFCHLPRGTVFTIGETNLLALGGAVSIDRGSRTLGKSYWLEEAITEDDVQACLNNVKAFGEKIDVMLTHDAPFRPPGFNRIASGVLGEELNTNLVRVRSVWENVKPSMLIHGHWHHRYEALELYKNDSPASSFLDIVDDRQLQVEEKAGLIVGLDCENVATSVYAISSDKHLD